MRAKLAGETNQRSICSIDSFSNEYKIKDPPIGGSFYVKPLMF
jgi:hypothetical protein